MSAQGDHNLDNDSASDLLHEISEDLTGRILQLLEDPHSHEYDDERCAELFVRIELLFALHGRRMLRAAPEPEVIRAMTGAYLTRWDSYHRAAGHEPPQKRKISMVETFDELHRICVESLEGAISLVPVEGDLRPALESGGMSGEVAKRISSVWENSPPKTP